MVTRTARRRRRGPIPSVVAALLLLAACDPVFHVNEERGERGSPALEASTALVGGAAARAAAACAARSTARSADPAARYPTEPTRGIAELVTSEPITGTGTHDERVGRARDRTSRRLRTNSLALEPRFDRVGSGEVACADGRLYTVMTLSDTDPTPAGPSLGPVTVGPVEAGERIRFSVRVRGRGDRPVLLEVIDGFDAPRFVAMGDGGLNGDAVRGDGIYSRDINPRSAGALVRYRVHLGDGDDVIHSPAKHGRRTYAGLVVERPEVDTQLPVLDWYLPEEDAAWLTANRDSKEYKRGVAVIDGEVIDGVDVRNQGGVTARLSPKPNYKLKMPKDVTVTAPFFDEPVSEFVIDADFEDPTLAIGPIAWDLLAAAGHPPREASTARVERNGSFYGVYQLYEEMDEEWLDRVGPPTDSVFDGDLALLQDWGSVEAMLEQWEQQSGPDATADLLHQTMIDLSTDDSLERSKVLHDRFDMPRLIDLLAMSALMQHFDSVETNLVLVHRADTDRFQLLTNDMDLLLGLRGRTRMPTFSPSPMSPTLVALYGETDLLDLINARASTLFEEHFAGPRILAEAEARVESMRADLALDRAAWPLDLPAVDTGLADLEDYLGYKRDLVATWRADLAWRDGDPGAIRISEISAAGMTADFVELTNPTAVPVDVSGWKLTGAADVTLPGGSVIAGGGSLMVPEDPAAIGALGLGIPVAGRLAGPLPSAGGTVTVSTGGGAVVDAVIWGVGGAWPAMGPGGTLEAIALDGGRAAPGGWRISDGSIGSPGVPNHDRLDVDVWYPASASAQSVPSWARVLVTNRDSHGHGDVTVAGPSGTCGAPAHLPVGSRLVRWCPVPVGERISGWTVEVTAEDPTVTTSRFRHGGDHSVLGGGPSHGMAAYGLRLGDDGPIASPSPEAAALPGYCPDLRVALLDEVGPEALHRSVAAPGGSVRMPDGGTWRVAAGCQRDIFVVSWQWSPPFTAGAGTWWPAIDPTGFTEAMHQRVLGRAATTTEIDHWAAEFAGGADPVELVEELVGPGTDPAAWWGSLVGGSPDADWLAAADVWLASGGDAGTVLESARSAIEP